jgi:oligopeptide transport system permease protein
MAGFLLRRILSSIVVLLCAASITFLLSVSQKGGPFEKEKLSELAKAEKEKQYGLDGPRWLQLARYQKRLILEGDMNVSLRYKDRGVAEVLGQKFPNSLVLGACAFLVASIGGVLAGCVAAMKKDTWVDASAMLVALAAISVPTFITGPVLVAVFGLWLRWLPIGGFGNAAQLVMPSVCLALPFMAYVARLMRNSLLDVMSQPHMRTAKAKGLAPAAAIARHAMKVAILPVVTYLGPMAAYVLTGSFVVETVFNIPGVGGVFVNAIQNVDPFLLTGAVIVYAALIVFFNLVVDVVYVFLDKRIRLHG